jgi:hypothetical protein
MAARFYDRGYNVLAMTLPYHGSKTRRNQDRQVDVPSLLCGPAAYQPAARNACHRHAIPQAAGDIQNLVGVAHEILRPQLRVRGIHPVRQ